MKILCKKLLSWIVLLIVSFTMPTFVFANLATVPRHTIDNSISIGQSQAKLIYDIHNGFEFSDVLIIKNLDATRSVDVEMSFKSQAKPGIAEIPKDWISFSPRVLKIQPVSEKNVLVNIKIPEETQLAPSYLGAILSSLKAYQAPNGKMTSISVGVGIKLHLYYKGGSTYSPKEIVKPSLFKLFKISEVFKLPEIVSIPSISAFYDDVVRDYENILVSFKQTENNDFALLTSHDGGSFEINVSEVIYKAFVDSLELKESDLDLSLRLLKITRSLL